AGAAAAAGPADALVSAGAAEPIEPCAACVPPVPADASAALVEPDPGATPGPTDAVPSATGARPAPDFAQPGTTASAARPPRISRRAMTFDIARILPDPMCGVPRRSHSLHRGFMVTCSRRGAMEMDEEGALRLGTIELSDAGIAELTMQGHRAVFVPRAGIER